MNKLDVIDRFKDERNVQRGWGRVIWAPLTTTMTGDTYPPGWVLPGGRRTLDEAEAIRVADAIHLATMRTQMR
jgi:hypothetical protein